MTHDTGASGGDGPFERERSDRRTVAMTLPVIEVAHAGRSWRIGSILRIPAGDANSRRGAVVIVHGSSGIDSRGGAYAAALNLEGLATLEIDLWTARGVSSPASRPRSPVETLPDAFAALAYLAAHTSIDPDRIGLMGFSWGGVVTMLAATSRAHGLYARTGDAYAAFAPFYPVCWAYNKVPGFEFADLAGGPVLIQAGACDRYDDPDTCERLHAALAPADQGLVTVITYPGATHAFDRREADIVVDDPFSHKGAGGPTPFSYSPETTRRATDAVAAFFSRSLGAG